MPDRLRTPPAERFAPPALKFDLHEVAEKLRREPTPSRDGHRQMALYKNGDATTAVFVFEPGGTLPPHAASGTVIIHAIEGEFQVLYGDHRYSLRPGQLLTLAPDAPHDVRCPRGGVMLLTVSLQNGDPPATDL